MKWRLIILVCITMVVLLIVVVYSAPVTNQVIPTSSDYADIGTSSGSCDIATINSSNEISCDLVSMDGGDTGYINITHASSITDGSEMGDVFACIKFHMTIKTEDDETDNLVVEIGYGAGGLTWNTTPVINVSGINVEYYQVERIYCWNVTDFIDSETKAEDVKIKITYTEGSDPNQGMHVDFSYVNITYDPPAGQDTCDPGAENWVINCSDSCNWTTDFTVFANITMIGSGTLTWDANMTMNATIPWEIYKEDGCKMVINPGGSIR